MSKVLKEQIKDNENEIDSIKNTISTIEENSLKYKGIYYGSLDDLKTTGIYYTDSVEPDMSPISGFTYAVIIVINTDGLVTQIATRAGYALYMRRTSVSGSVWASWHKYLGEVV